MYQAANKDLPLGGEDWWNYHRGAQNLIVENSNFLEMLFISSSDMFTKFVAVIYSIFGVHTMQINLYVLTSSLIAARYVLRSAMLLTDNDYKASSQAMLLFLVWPLDIIYSVTYLREMPVQMFVIVSFFYFVRYVKYKNIFDIILSLLSIALGSMMHSGVIALVVIYIFFMRSDDKKTFRQNVSVANIAVAAILMFAVMVSPLWDSMMSKFGDVSSVESLVDRVGQFTEGDASTRYITDMPDNIFQLIFQIPYRTALFAVVPLPWMINGVDTAISWALDAVPQIWILYRLYKLFKTSKKSTSIHFFVIVGLIAVIMTYAICAMGTTAYGNTIRHRAKILPMVLVFVVAVYGHLNPSKKGKIRQ